MKKIYRYWCVIVALGILGALVMPTLHARANGPTAEGQPATDLAPGSAQLLNPEDLFNIIQSPKAEKPLILNVGPHLLYMQAHIPGSEYIGARFGFAGN